MEVSPVPNRIFTADELGQAIRTRRRALALTQGDLAMQAGLSVATISAIENGKNTARIGLVLDLCRDLGLHLNVSAPDA